MHHSQCFRKNRLLEIRLQVPAKLHTRYMSLNEALNLFSLAPAFVKLLLLAVRRMDIYTMGSSVCMLSTIIIFIKLNSCPKHFGSLVPQSFGAKILLSSLLLSLISNSTPFRIQSKLLSSKCPFMIWPHLSIFQYFKFLCVSIGITNHFI